MSKQYAGLCAGCAKHAREHRPQPSAWTEVLERRFHAWAVTFSVLSVGGVGGIHNGRFTFHFLLSDSPQYLGPCIGLAASCWINHFFFRWRLHPPK